MKCNMKSLRRTRITCWGAFLPGGGLKTSLSSGISNEASSSRTKPLVIPPLQTPKSQSTKAKTKRTEKPRRNAGTPMVSKNRSCGWWEMGFSKWVYVMEWDNGSGCDEIAKLHVKEWECFGWFDDMQSKGDQGERSHVGRYGCGREISSEWIIVISLWQLGMVEQLNANFEEHRKLFHILMEGNMHLLKEYAPSFSNYML